jgi:tRNA(Ile)-lysidine synthase
MSPRPTQFARRLEKRIADFVLDRDVIRRGESIIVGVSGGPDSTALIVLLSRLRREFRLKIVAAHFDHRLRSRAEAAGDRAFVTRLCRSLRVPLITGGGDVRRRARSRKESVEEAARNLRYAFLGREASRAGATAVVVGHTLNDRAETVLLHVVRGSGLDGLAALPPRSPWPFGAGPDIARPLLQVSRREIERYCADLGFEPRRDPTNDLPIATRNRFRNEVIPLLSSLNPNVEEALARLADTVTGDADYLDSLAELRWKELARVGARQVTFPREEVAHVPPAIAARLLRRAAAAIGAQPEAVHLEAAIKALDRKRYQGSIPGGQIELDSTSLTVTRRPRAKPKTPFLPNKLTIPGRTRAGSWNIEATRVERDAALPRDAYSALVDVDAVDGPLLIRPRKPGDRLRPLGLNGTKKLQDILVDARVPLQRRDSVPLVADRKGVIWVVGHCIDQRVALSSKTRRVLRLRARRRGR